MTDENTPDDFHEDDLDGDHDHDAPDGDVPDGDVPDGAALFPEIPDELGVDPLLLAVVHATVFIAGSTPDIVHPEASDEAMGGIVEYLRRLEGARLERVREDMDCLTSYARQQKWPKPLILALKTFLADIGVDGPSEA